MDFAIHQHESVIGICVSPYPKSPPTSLPISSLWVDPVHRLWVPGFMHQTWTGRLFHIWSYICLEKEMATHSSILAWRILWTEEPTVHRVARVWHDLATKPPIYMFQCYSQIIPPSGKTAAQSRGNCLRNRHQDGGQVGRIANRWLGWCGKPQYNQSTNLRGSLRFSFYRLTQSCTKFLP